MPGGIGQNGSVDWVVTANKGNIHTHTNQGNGHGGQIEDPIDEFTVRMRFKDQAEADAAWAARTHGDAYGRYVVMVKVPAAQPKDSGRIYTDLDPHDEPNKNPPWEVHVDWDVKSNPAPLPRNPNVVKVKAVRVAPAGGERTAIRQTTKAKRQTSKAKRQGSKAKRQGSKTTKLRKR